MSEAWGLLKLLLALEGLIKSFRAYYISRQKEADQELLKKACDDYVASSTKDQRLAAAARIQDSFKAKT